MKYNIGYVDRAFRFVAGIGLIGATLAGWIGAWGWIGVIPLITSLIRFCPLYAILGINTCPRQNKQSNQDI